MPGAALGRRLPTDLSVAGVPVSPGSLALYAVTVTTLLSALLLPVVGASSTGRATSARVLARFAWLGAAAAAAMVFVRGDGWQLGVLSCSSSRASPSAARSSSTTRSSSTSRPQTSATGVEPGLGDRVPGGGLLLALDLVLVQGHVAFGLSREAAVRLSLLSAGLWWGAFTLVPYLGLRDRPPRDVVPEAGRGLLGAAFGQLATTLRDLRRYPQTLRFLLAYLFFNDGIQTVIYAASIFAAEELGLPRGSSSGRSSSSSSWHSAARSRSAGSRGRVGAQRCDPRRPRAVGRGRGAGDVLPAGRFGPFLALAVLIGIVLGGTQALARSLVQPAGAAGPGGGVLQPLPGGRARHELVGTLLFGWSSSSPTPTGPPSSPSSRSSSWAAACWPGWTSGGAREAGNEAPA